MRERIGFDFDGTLTKLPPVFRFLHRFLNSATTPEWIHRNYYRIALKVPIFLDRKRLKALEKWRGFYKYYVITGRRDQRLVEQALIEYFYLFEDIITSERSNLPTFEFKERVCKQVGVDWYFEDNSYTLAYLRSKGIRAIRK